MRVIAEIRIPSTDFELGRILPIEHSTAIELETLVPIGDATVPLFWVYNSAQDSFLETVQRYPSVSNAAVVDVFEDRTLFSIEWEAHHDLLIEGISETGGQILHAAATGTSWEFELRFPSHDALTEFNEHCEDAQINLEVSRVYNPTSGDVGPWFGMTAPQREAITLAVKWGYYNIPRGCTTKELAAELGISDQAVTERLRRAIVSFVRNSTLAPDTEA